MFLLYMIYDTTLKIPATALVAACIRAEIIVGPSMASSSQTWSGNWLKLYLEKRLKMRLTRAIRLLPLVSYLSHATIPISIIIVHLNSES